MEIFDENGKLKPKHEIEQTMFFEALSRNPTLVDMIANGTGGCPYCG